jgi:hypothetical protein
MNEPRVLCLPLLAALAAGATGCFGGSSSAGSSGSPDGSLADGSSASAGDAAGSADAPSEGGAIAEASATDGESSESSVPDGGGAPDAGCVAPAGLPLVTPVYSDAGGAPEQTGGTLASGTYDVTSVTVYETTCGASVEDMLGEQVALSLTYGSATQATGMESHVAEVVQPGGSPQIACKSTALQVNGAAIGNATNDSVLQGQFTVTSTGFTLVTTSAKDDAATCQALYTLAKQ